jgi:hypothetical protein
LNNKKKPLNQKEMERLQAIKALGDRAVEAAIQYNNQCNISGKSLMQFLDKEFSFESILNLFDGLDITDMANICVNVQ